MPTVAGCGRKRLRGSGADFFTHRIDPEKETRRLIAKLGRCTSACCA
jgi:hypothetical protein